MLVTMPKLTVTNQYKETAIFTSSILGFEPATLHFKGKTSTGVKVYTDKGAFKVFSDPVEFATKLAFAKQTGESVNILPMGKPQYKPLDVQSVNANVKMLQAGK